MSSDGMLHKPAAREADEITLLGTFRSRELEQACRRHYLAADKVLASWCIALSQAGALIFATSDYRFLWDTEPRQFFLLLVLRVAFVLLCAVYLVMLRRRKEPAGFDLIVLCFAVSLAIINTYIGSTRPPAFVGYLMFTGLMVILTYCVVPLPLIQQIPPAMVFTMGTAVLLWRTKQVDDISPMLTNAVAQSFLMSHALGIATSYFQQRRRRQLFAAVMQQAELRENLEQAITEIRTLRGILPICSNCKRVRNDAGAWEQVEVYVRKHTHAEFSHDICPECEKKLYPKYS